MYKIKEDSLEKLNNAFNLLDQIEVKGVDYCHKVATIAALINDVFHSIDQSQSIEETIKIDNTTKKEGSK